MFTRNHNCWVDTIKNEEWYGAEIHLTDTIYEPHQENYWKTNAVGLTQF